MKTRHPRHIYYSETWLFVEWCNKHVGLPSCRHAPRTPWWHVFRRLRWCLNERRLLIARGERAWNIRWRAQIRATNKRPNIVLMRAWHERGVSPHNPARFLMP